MKTVTLKIPLLVGSNGKWCSNGYTSIERDGVDWVFMSDSLEGDDGKFPSVERRYMVKVSVEVPDGEAEEIDGIAETSS